VTLKRKDKLTWNWLDKNLKKVEVSLDQTPLGKQVKAEAEKQAERLYPQLASYYSKLAVKGLNRLGFPDFDQSRSVDHIGYILAPLDSAGDHVLIPTHLKITDHKDKQLDFTLEFVRGSRPDSPPAPYAKLDFRVAPYYHKEEALTLIREERAGATLTTAYFIRGFLHVKLLENADGTVFQESRKTIPLAWNGLDTARVVTQFSSNAATLLEQSIQGGVLPLEVIAEVETLGISPRLPLMVKDCDPEILLRELGRLKNTEGHVSRRDIVNYFQSNLKSLPLRIEGGLDVEDNYKFAEIMADRVQLYFGCFVPTPLIEIGAHTALTPPEEWSNPTKKALVSWFDLSVPVPVSRVYFLSLDCFETGKQLQQVAQMPQQSIILRTIVPPLPTGHVRVDVAINIPFSRQGIEALGVELTAAPNPPYRSESLDKTIEIPELQETLTVDLQFSPREQPVYTYVTHAALKETNWQNRFEKNLGSKTNLSDVDILYLNPDDFAVDFIPIEASPDLLEIAIVRGLCKRVENGITINTPFNLHTSQPKVNFALSKNAQDAAWEIKVESLEGLGILQLEPKPAKPLHLDLFSLKEYGAQKVEIKCVFEHEQKPVLFEFLPEGISPTAAKVIFFTPSKTIDVFRWLSRSPFQARYQYRQKPVTGNDASFQWSNYYSPFEPLTIHL
jgi:hypothetical protein